MFVGFILWIFSMIFRKRPAKKKELPDTPMEEKPVEEEQGNSNNQILPKASPRENYK
jgi:hypothetical protein